MAARSGFVRRLGRVFGVSAAMPHGQVAGPIEPLQGAASQGGGAVTSGAGQGPLPVTGGGAAAGAGRQAIVADDSEINRIILRTFLERLGFRVTLAASGREAVALWTPDHDLVCLDIEMPDLGGAEAFERIKARALAEGREVPMALAVTANAMTERVTSYMRLGFDGCLGRPFSRGDLVALLRQRWPMAG